MEVNKKQIVEVTITLTEKEALILKAMMQNGPPGEARPESDFREQMFLHLSAALKARVMS